MPPSIAFAELDRGKKAATIAFWMVKTEGKQSDKSTATFFFWTYPGAKRENFLFSFQLTVFVKKFRWSKIVHWYFYDAKYVTFSRYIFAEIFSGGQMTTSYQC